LVAAEAATGLKVALAIKRAARLAVTLMGVSPRLNARRGHQVEPLV
jgi:hypothetical protein